MNKWIEPKVSNHRETKGSELQFLFPILHCFPSLSCVFVVAICERAEVDAIKNHGFS